MSKATVSELKKRIIRKMYRRAIGEGGFKGDIEAAKFILDLDDNEVAEAIEMDSEKQP